MDKTRLTLSTKYHSFTIKWVHLDQKWLVYNSCECQEWLFKGYCWMLGFYWMGGTLFGLNYSTRKKKSFTCWAFPIPVLLLYFLSLVRYHTFGSVSPTTKHLFLETIVILSKLKCQLNWPCLTSIQRGCVHWSVEGPWFPFVDEALQRLHVFCILA